ncbi:MAG: hypothetical protein K1060chlam5_00288 [Candidatus Anoxychlamydiales bacterium]|nr:hypothetical protein [Candidatus Anoxychlamydiales bacterium]
MKVFQSFAKILIIVLMSIVLARSSKKVFNFSQNKINIENTVFIEDDLKSYDHILKQKFYYLSQGSQFYVFISEDKNYVIKFLKSYRQDRFFYKFLKLFSNKHQRKDFYQKLKFHNLKKNIFQVYENLKDQTALIYVHLNNTKSNKFLNVYYKLHRKHNINLDRSYFVIQKKVQCIYDIFHNKYISNDYKKNLILLYFNLIKDIDKTGFAYDDYHLKNIGIHENKLIIFDIGSFHFKDNKKISEYDMFKKNTYRLFDEIKNNIKLNTYYIDRFDEYKK